MTISPKAVGNIAIELLVNIALPYVIYVKAEAESGSGPRPVGCIPASHPLERD